MTVTTYYSVIVDGISRSVLVMYHEVWDVVIIVETWSRSPAHNTTFINNYYKFTYYIILFITIIQFHCIYGDV